MLAANSAPGCGIHGARLARGNSEDSMSTKKELTPPRGRNIYCNRTLNLNSIKAVGYDMDYTIIQYHMEPWERMAFDYLKDRLQALDWPVSALKFDPKMVIRGLVIDTHMGNILKANRFGYVKRAFHGTRPLDLKEQRKLYSRTAADAFGDRFVFMHTLFSLSVTSMYMQLVAMLDEGKLPGVMGYESLYQTVSSEIDIAHLEGRLKAEISSDPDKYVAHDPNVAWTLLDQKDAGKKLLLITNSDWTYTKSMMSYALDQHLPEGMTWRDVFDLVIVNARKPGFFSSDNPIFEIVDDEGLLKPCVFGITKPGVYLGGNATLVEKYLESSGDEILFVGDHIYADIHVSKNVLRWRTGLILSELEQEVKVQGGFADQQAELSELMRQKESLEAELYSLRLKSQRVRAGHKKPADESPTTLNSVIERVRDQISKIDEKITPLAKKAGELNNPNWGLLMRMGNDKSLFARQVESYADLYTSRVSSFMYQTPFAFFRSVRGSLPHDVKP